MPRTKRNRKNRFVGEGTRSSRTKEEWEEMKKENPELGRQNYKLTPKTNPVFERFYQGIGIVPEEDWEKFMETMRIELPATFRISGSRSQAQELLKIIKGQYFNKFLGKDKDGVQIEPRPIPWYPDELAWQMDITKKQIKNTNTLKSLHGFLISETESGNISRQEAVSMIPPLVMDIQPHHKVLDMCAAPGSKTAQLIEMLHSDENQPIPEGFVVANDMDNKRCYLMTHQVKRIQSPNCMIINHDARILPNMSLSPEEGAEFLRYDRILCDVPCTGDGTMRKNPDIWRKWHVNGAYNLHRIQKKVLQRGLELLAVGGKLVYSTCSLNPVEDEAVILALIKQCGGAIELLDVSEKLPGLKYSKGTYSWKVMAKDGSWYETVGQAPPNFQNLWDHTMYPPLITDAQDAKLERCIRILPYHQNTGAFFIAVLHKTAEVPWSSRKSDPTINPKLKLDGGEKQDPVTEHFSFDVRTGSGLYVHAKCNLCNVQLAGQGDYNSHKQGRKHALQLSQLKDGDNEKEKSDSVKDCESKLPDTKTNGQSESTDESVKTTETVQSADSVKESSDIVKASENDSTGQTEEKTDAIGEKMEVEEEKSESADAHVGSTVSKEDKVPAETGQGDQESSSPPPAKKLKTGQEEAGADNSGIQVKMQGHKEDPFYFCGVNDPIWPSIKEFYQLTDELNVEQLMYRNMKRVLYFVSKPIRKLVIANHHKVKFINLGVKCFSNAPSPLVTDCDYRLSQEGLLAVERYVGGRRMNLSKPDLVTILSQENPFICKLSQQAQDQAYAMGPGSTLFSYKPTESDPEPNVEIVFCGWRGKTSVRSFVGKDERSHYLRLCGVELTDIQAQVQAEKAAKLLAPDCLSTSSGAGTETPVGVPSGDEEEVTQWTEGVKEAPRGTEEDELEVAEGNGGGADKEGADNDSDKQDGAYNEEIKD